jgi:hypothetical protein
MPYAARRAVNLMQEAGTNPRVGALASISPLPLLSHSGAFKNGTLYWTNDAFLFADEAGASFRVDSWLQPLDALMRLYWNDPIDDTSIPPRGLNTWHLVFPLGSRAAARIAGVTADKIRFFTRAYRVGTLDALAPLMHDAAYAGDVLFVLPAPPVPLADDAAHRAGLDDWTGRQDLSADDTRLLAYRVLQFDANNLVVAVSNPGGSATWMSYADVWHPGWRATVNGTAVPVYRADMAYKAVPLEAGDNVVHFRFSSPRFVGLSGIYAAGSVCWLLGIGALAVGIVRRD